MAPRMKRRRRRRDGNEEGVFRILGQKIDYNTAPIKIIAPCLHLPPYFRARVIRWCYLSFPLPILVAMATNFGTKLTIIRLSQKLIAHCFHLRTYPLFLGPGYAMVSCKFLS